MGLTDSKPYTLEDKVRLATTYPTCDITSEIAMDVSEDNKEKIQIIKTTDAYRDSQKGFLTQFIDKNGVIMDSDIPAPFHNGKSPKLFRYINIDTIDITCDDENLD